MIIRASDPNAPDNLYDYNFAEQIFKPRPSDPKNDCAIHFDKAYRCVPSPRPPLPRRAFYTPT